MFLWPTRVCSDHGGCHEWDLSPLSKWLQLPIWWDQSSVFFFTSERLFCVYATAFQSLYISHCIFLCSFPPLFLSLSLPLFLPSCLSLSLHPFLPSPSSLFCLPCALYMWHDRHDIHVHPVRNIAYQDNDVEASRSFHPSSPELCGFCWNSSAGIHRTCKLALAALVWLWHCHEDLVACLLFCRTMAAKQYLLQSTAFFSWPPWSWFSPIPSTIHWSGKVSTCSTRWQTPHLRRCVFNIVKLLPIHLSLAVAGLIAIQ